MISLVTPLCLIICKMNIMPILSIWKSDFLQYRFFFHSGPAAPREKKTLYCKKSDFQMDNIDSVLQKIRSKIGQYRQQTRYVQNIPVEYITYLPSILSQAWMVGILYSFKFIPMTWKAQSFCSPKFLVYKFNLICKNQNI